MVDQFRAVVANGHAHQRVHADQAHEVTSIFGKGATAAHVATAKDTLGGAKGFFLGLARCQKALEHFDEVGAI
ncbi:hypothetical protein D9M71_259020 [compost metagenome]